MNLRGFTGTTVTPNDLEMTLSVDSTLMFFPVFVVSVPDVGGVFVNTEQQVVPVLLLLGIFLLFFFFFNVALKHNRTCSSKDLF